MRLAPAVRALAAIALLAFPSCAADEEPLPLDDASRSRGLPFLTDPVVVHMSRDAYLRAEAAEARETPDEDVAYLHAVWGRLGYFAPDYDVRAALAGQASLVGAFYDSRAKVVTVFDGVAKTVLVHELVHVLQDQHFDLLKLRGDSAVTSDQSLALAALVEGDAEFAEQRFQRTSAGRDPVAAGPELVDVDAALDLATRVITRAKLPPFFVARPSFAYGYGMAYVAHLAGLAPPPAVWDTSRIDAVFRDGGPRSTQEVLHAGAVPDPIEDVGLVDLPADLAGRLAIAEVDRLGEWFIALLLRDATADAIGLAARWDGDQLVTFVAPGERVPRGLVWTTAWDDPSSAAAFESAMVVLHPPGGSGEPMLLERRGSRVVFARGLAGEDLHALADAALHPDATKARLPVQRQGLVTEPTWPARAGVDGFACLRVQCPR